MLMFRKLVQVPFPSRTIQFCYASCLGDNLHVNLQAEFGRSEADGKKEVMSADEISPDTCRLWDMRTDKKLDKDRFRKDLGDLIPAYTEVAKRLGILQETSNIKEVKFTKPSSIKLKKK